MIKPMYQTKEFNTQMQFLDRRNHTGQNPSMMTGSHLNILTDELKYLINETTETDTGASDRTRRRYVPREAKIIGLDSIVSKLMYQTKEFNAVIQVLDRTNHTGQNPSNTPRNHTNILMDEQFYLIIEATETDTGLVWDLAEKLTKFNSSPRVLFKSENSTLCTTWYGGVANHSLH